MFFLQNDVKQLLKKYIFLPVALIIALEALMSLCLGNAEWICVSRCISLKFCVGVH